MGVSLLYEIMYARAVNSWGNSISGAKEDVFIEQCNDPSSRCEEQGDEGKHYLAVHQNLSKHTFFSHQRRIVQFQCVADRTRRSR
jgi:hypothetical protein